MTTVVNVVYDHDGVKTVDENVVVMPLADLIERGMIWLLNAACLHPRGYATRLHYDGDEVVGWSVVGDGTEPWSFDPNDAVVDDRFHQLAATLSEAAERWSRRRPHRPSPTPGDVVRDEDIT